jgi:hypothetical protein
LPVGIMERCGFSHTAGGWTTLFNLVFYFLQSLPNIWCDGLFSRGCGGAPSLSWGYMH